MAETDMAAIFARKAALRKGMLRTLRQLPEDALASQCTSAAFRSLLPADLQRRL